MEKFNNAKIPPSSLQSEQSVLGGILLYNESFDEIISILGIDDFYHEAHKIIFEKIQNLIEHNLPADILTVKAALEKTNEEKQIGGFVYLATIADNTPSVDNVNSYAKHVRELSVYRQLIHISNELAGSAYNPKNISIEELIDTTESKIFNISEQLLHNKSNINNIKDMVKDLVADIQLRHEQDGIFGLETGFKELDKITSGLQKGNLIVIAGRPGMGKTSLAMNIVENVAIKNHKSVAVFSLEMPVKELIMRVIASSFKINMKKMQDGNMSVGDWDKFNQAVEILKNTNIIIDDAPLLTPNELRAKARRIKRKHPDLALIVIDYLQLMQVTGHSENRNQEISQISRLLKALAKELELPIIALSQLNRNVENRPKLKKGRMPQMSDLRESGSIEQDADIVAFIYRDEVYFDENFSVPEEIGKADLKIAKHRNGSTGFIKLNFEGKFTRFDNLSVQINDEYIDSQIINSEDDLKDFNLDEYSQTM